MIAIHEDEWLLFHDLPSAELAEVLVNLAWSVCLPRLRKHPRRPKKPKPSKQSGPKITHVATAKFLKGRHACANICLQRAAPAMHSTDQAEAHLLHQPTRPIARPGWLRCQAP